MTRAARGVTLIELLIVLGVLGILAAVVFMSFRGASQQQALNSEVENVMSVLSDARTRTLSSKGATEYGVHFDADRAVLFPGSSYTAGDPSNEVHELSPPVVISDVSLSDSLTDVVFARLSGGAQATGTVTLALSYDASTTRSIVIKDSGVSGRFAP